MSDVIGPQASAGEGWFDEDPWTDEEMDLLAMEAGEVLDDCRA